MASKIVYEDARYLKDLLKGLSLWFDEATFKITPEDLNEDISNLEKQGILTRINPFREVNLLEKILQKIDTAYLFAEHPTLFISKKPEYPSVLIYNVAVYKVHDVEKVKHKLKLEGIK